MTFFSLTDVLPRTSAAPSSAEGLARVPRLTDRERLELLLHAGEILARTDGPEVVLRELARCLVPRLGDCCTIDVLGPDADTPRLLAVAHGEPESAPRIRESRRQNPLAPEEAAGVMRVLHTGRAELHAELPDPAGAPGASLRSLRELGMASAIVVPIRAPDALLGAITVASTQARRYDATDVRVLEEIGRVAGMGLPRARLGLPSQPFDGPESVGRARTEQERERLLFLEKQARAAAEIAVHRISTLQTVTAALSEALTLQQVADIIVGEGVASLGAQQGALYLFDPDRQALELVAARGLVREPGCEAPPSSAAPRLSLDARSTAVSAACAGTPVWVTGRGELERLYPDTARSFDGDLALEAVAGIPLSVRDRVAGALILGFDEPRPFPDEERHFALALVRHCAQAIDRARLYEAERSGNRRLELLARAGDQLASSLDYETTLANVAEIAIPALADFAFLDVVEGTQVRRIARGADVAPGLFPGLGRCACPAVDDAFLRSVAQSPQQLPLLRDLGLGSLVRVPLTAHDQALGALTFCLAASGRRHTAADRELCDELARRAAIAIENAILHRASREATQRAQEANRRSEQASRTKDEFLGVVSHELRTPLNAVLGWSQLLRGSSSADPALLAKGLKVIDRNARAQAKLIEDILDVSRIITGKLRLEPRPLELESVIRSSLEVIRPAADAKSVELRSIVDEPAAVSGDPDRLQQVVWNLLSNAVKFTPQGGRVEIRLVRRGHAAEIVVRDSGRGIEPEFLPFVFDRFRQADSSPTRRHGGLGLGLSIVRHLVELHGGSVRAESEGPGHGSAFTVRLPLREDDTSSGERDSASRAPRETDPGPTIVRLDGLRVLVVDDEPDARELIATMLTSSGAVAAVAGSAAEALGMLTSFAPDVLVSDVGMPGEDGYGLIRKVRSSGTRQARIPALALTAYAGPDDARRAILAGFHTHLPKPAEPGMLTAVVASLGGRVTV